MAVTIKCSACGAPVEVPLGSGNATCSFCGAVTALAPQNVSSAPTIALSREQLPPAAALGESHAPAPEPPAAAATILAGSAAQVRSRFNSSAELMDEVKRLLKAGRKIDAVNVHRAYFNTSLEDSLAAVEQVETDLRPAQPVRPAPAVSAVRPPAAAAPQARKGLSGCVWAIIAALILAGFVCLAAVILILVALF